MSTPETAPRRSPTRVILLIVGSVLWLVVGIAAAMMMRLPPADVADNDSGLPEGTVAIDPAQPATEAVWSKDGIEDFTFTNTDGQTVTKADLLGKPAAYAFIFTRCGYTCPMITAAMRRLQDQLKDKDVRFVSITVDPEFDTPERLKTYAENQGADLEKWTFLSGDQTQTYRLIEKSFLLPVKEMQGPDRKPGFEVLHSNNIMYVNAEGVVVGKYLGTDEADVVKLRNELTAEADAIAKGKTGDSDAAPPAGEGAE